MNRLPLRALCAGAALVWATSSGAQTALSPPGSAPPVQPTAADVMWLDLRIQLRTAPIRSRDDFDAYMRANPSRANPVNLLSADGRRRFAASLNFEIFRQGGISDPGDIEAELSLSQAWRLLSLFGAEQTVMFMPDIRIEKTELSEALERIRLLATRDSLTGLLNRRAGQDELRRATGLAVRSARPLVLALADLDHFKQINDSFGHQAGDRVLQAFARAAERELRGADRVTRWGGEEFLFVLPDTDGPQACICLDRLRSAFSELNIDGVPSTRRLSFSAGVALCSGPDDIEAAIERADRAMYSAKLAGRNRTKCLQPVPGEASEQPSQSCALHDGTTEPSMAPL